MAAAPLTRDLALAVADFAVAIAVQNIAGAPCSRSPGRWRRAGAFALAVVARAVPARVRSTVLGMVTAAGSLGSVLAAPLGRILSDSEGWRAGVFAFAALASLMLTGAWLAGGVDRLDAPRVYDPPARGTAREAIASAFRNNAFLIMAGAYFECGYAAHLHRHLFAVLSRAPGRAPMLSAEALAVIAAFNVAGSLFFRLGRRPLATARPCDARWLE